MKIKTRQPNRQEINCQIIEQELPDPDWNILDRMNALREELQQIVTTHIAYISHTERIHEPLVHTTFNEYHFKTVRIIGRIVAMRKNKYYIYTVTDFTGDIKCIMKNARAKRGETLYTKHFDDFQAELFDTKNKLAKLRKKYKNEDPPTEEEKTYKQRLILREQIAEKSIESLQKEKDRHNELKLGVNVEIIGNIGRYSIYPKVIYIQSYRIIKDFEQEYEYFSRYIENKFKSSFEKLKINCSKPNPEFR